MTNTQKTKDIFLSIAIPVWNRYEEVVRAVESVGLERYHDVELIIVDNQSEDIFWNRICFKYKNHKQIKLYRNEENIGMTRNWNKAMSFSKGDWISLLCSDDGFLDDGLVRAYNLLKSIKPPSLVIQNPNIKENQYLSSGLETSRKINLPIASGNFVHRECIDELGYFDERIKYSPDAEYWVRISTKFPVILYAGYFGYFLSHNENNMWETWVKDDYIDQIMLISELNSKHMKIKKNLIKEDVQWGHYLFFVKNSIGKKQKPFKKIVNKCFPMVKKNAKGMRKLKVLELYLIWMYRVCTTKYIRSVVRRVLK